MESKNAMKKVTLKEGESLDIVSENLGALKIIIPGAFTEDGVDFDTLRQLLGDEVDEGDEKYGLTWHGKKKARQIALTPSTGTLRPCPEESVDWETTQNLFIEGDNLEVLKLLQKSYAGKIKMIYIDPPYNTGKEFVYPDNYQDNLDTYLKYTGQLDSEGMAFTSNKETSGRKHTNWLNMILPRIKLARNLLSEDGVFLASIDENEHANLKKVCELVFGEENFCGEIVWKNGSKNDQKYISIQHEYFVIFVKDKNINKGDWVEKKAGLAQIYSAFNGFRNEFGEDWKAIHKAALDWYKQFPGSNPILNSKHYSWMDERGVYFPDNVSGPNDGQYVYDVLHPNTNQPVKPPSRGWFCPKDKMLQLIKENRIHFGNDHTTVPNLKTYLNNTEYQSLTSIRFLDRRAASKRLQNLFGEKVFTNPKDEILLKEFFKAFGIGKSDIVLDFFAGSGTTMHAVFELNKEQRTFCRTILVQLPEDLHAMHKIATGAAKKTTKNAIRYLTQKGVPQNICEIGKERIRLMRKRFGGDLLEQNEDLGFKVFKLDSSNIQAWNPDKSDLEQTLLDHVEHLVEGRSEEDVLYELLLKRGVDLSVPIEKKEIEGTAVYSIGYGVLFACLDKSISRDEVESLAQGIVDWYGDLEPATDTQIVFRDSAFTDDIAKTNMTAILEQNGIAHVRSL